MVDIKYVASDAHKATISVAALNPDAKLVTQAVIQTDANAIRDFLRGLSGAVRLTFEEGTHSQRLFEMTRPLVNELLVCNAKHSSSVGNKGGKIDALRLARGLRAGLLKAVCRRPAPTYTLKQLAHIYGSITADTTGAMNRSKPLYTSRGIDCSGRDVYYGRNRRQWLDKLAQEGGRLRAESLYEQLDHLKPVKADAKKALLRGAQQHSALKRLQRVPGPGPARVAEIISAAGSPHRSRAKRRFWEYCGLAVVTRSSSDYEVVEEGLRRGANNIRAGGLNRGYNRRSKRAFKTAGLEASKDESVKDVYGRLTSKGIRPGMEPLTVARKLAAACLAMRESGEDFDERRLTKVAA
ncbi:MAG: transposase [Blastocatellia bacterium]